MEALIDVKDVHTICAEKFNVNVASENCRKRQKRKIPYMLAIAAGQRCFHLSFEILCHSLEFSLRSRGKAFQK